MTRTAVSRYRGRAASRILWILGLPASVLVGCSGTEGPATPGETVHSVEVLPSETVVDVGGAVALDVVTRTRAGKVVTGRAVTWSAQPSGRVAVSESGVVVGVDAGPVAVDATVDGRTGSANLWVRQPHAPPPPQLVVHDVRPSSIQAGWGGFSIVVEGAGFAPFAGVYWNELPLETVPTGSNELTATVLPEYVAHEGIVEITARTGPPSPLASNSLVFTVVPKPAFAVDLIVPGTATFVGWRVPLAAVVRDQFGAVIPGRAVVWASGSPEVASAEGEGSLRGLGVGWTTLTASAPPASRSTIFGVVPAPGVDLVVERATPVGAELFVVGLGPARTLRALLPPGSQAGQPSASPDGSRVVYVTMGPTGYGDLRIVDRTGTNDAPLVQGPATQDQPSWSPVGNLIAFRGTAGGKSDIWVVRSDGAGLHNLTGSEVFLPEEHNDRPAWSPNGDWIVFSRGFGLGQGLYKVHPDGTGLEPFLSRPGFDLLEPAWSPDGELIAYRERDRFSQTSRLAVASADGADSVFLFQDASAAAANPSWVGNAWLAVDVPSANDGAHRAIVLMGRGTGHSVVTLSSPHGSFARPTTLPRE